MATRPWSLAVPLAAVLFVAAPFVVPSWILFILHLALAKFLVVLAVALFLRGGLVSFGHALFYAALPPNGSGCARHCCSSHWAACLVLQWPP